MSTATLNPPVISSSPIYLRASKSSYGIYDLPKADYEELHKILLPYGSNITYEDAKKIGSFLLKLHIIVNTAKPLETDNIKDVVEEIKGANNGNSNTN